VLSYARNYLPIEFLCKHFEWICWKVFLVEMTGHPDMRPGGATGSRDAQTGFVKALKVNKQITCLTVVPEVEKKRRSGRPGGRQLTFFGLTCPLPNPN
jgi:hypothetical protein